MLGLNEEDHGRGFVRSGAEIRQEPSAVQVFAGIVWVSRFVGKVV